MKLTTAASLTLAALTAFAGPVRSATVVNRTIATVNGEAIIQSDFESRWKSFLEQQKNIMAPEQMTAEWKGETRKKLLEQMIDDRVLLQEAKKKKVKVSQRELENGVVQVKSRFLPEGGRRDLDALVQRQLQNTPQGQQPEASGIDLAGLWQQLAKDNPAAVKEAEAKFLEELRGEGLTDKKFQDQIRDQLSIVALTQQEVRARTKPPTDEQAKDLFAKLQAAMAGKPPAGLDPESAEDLDSMARFFTAQTGERLRARHILIRVPSDASMKDKSAARKKIEDLRAKILAGADFAELAEKNSDDKASAVRGGDLGPFGRGQMVPSFDKAAFALPVGELSDVVETDFGYHLIKVDEKRAAVKLRLEDVEDDLKEYLFRASAQKVFEDYVEDIRKQASVKVLVDPAAETPAKN